MEDVMATAARTQTPAVAVGERRIPPWAALGITFGLVSAISILTWGPIGVSGTYPRLIGALFRWVDPAYATANPYLQKMGSLFKPESFLVLGLVIGGFLAAKLGHRVKPVLGMIHSGERTVARRYTDAFIGGFLIVFGARVAGGCTSGHIISGITQGALSGLVFAAAVFATGIFTAKMLKQGGR
jgi:hypothetical protein